MSVLEALAARADRVASSRALALMPATMAAHVTNEDRRRMIRDLERRAGRTAARTRAADVPRTIQSLGLSLDGR